MVQRRQRQTRRLKINKRGGTYENNMELEQPPVPRIGVPPVNTRGRTPTLSDKNLENLFKLNINSNEFNLKHFTEERPPLEIQKNLSWAEAKKNSPETSAVAAFIVPKALKAPGKIYLKRQHSFISKNNQGGEKNIGYNTPVAIKTPVVPWAPSKKQKTRRQRQRSKKD